MKTLSLYFLLSMLTHSFYMPIIILFVGYLIFDRFYFGLLSGITAPIKRKKRIRALSDELLINHSNANSALELGTLYFESKRFNLAIELLQKAGQRIDDSARLHCYMGMAFAELGKFEESREELLKAVELNKGVCYGLPYIYLLEYELRQADVDSARVSELEASIDNYANTENFYRMGKLYRKLGFKGKAAEMFEHALKNYSYTQRSIRRLHRKWAFLSRFYRSFAKSVAIVAMVCLLIVSGFGGLAYYSLNKSPDIQVSSLNPVAPISISLTQIDNMLNSYVVFYTLNTENTLASRNSMVETKIELSGFKKSFSNEELLTLFPGIKKALDNPNNAFSILQKPQSPEMKSGIYVNTDKNIAALYPGRWYAQDGAASISKYLEGAPNCSFRLTLGFKGPNNSDDIYKGYFNFAFSGKIVDKRMIIDSVGGKILTMEQLNALLETARLVEELDKFSYKTGRYFLNSEEEGRLLQSMVNNYAFTQPRNFSIQGNRLVLSGGSRELGLLLSYIRYGGEVLVLKQIE